MVGDRGNEYLLPQLFWLTHDVPPSLNVMVTGSKCSTAVPRGPWRCLPMMISALFRCLPSASPTSRQIPPDCCLSGFWLFEVVLLAVHEPELPSASCSMEPDSLRSESAAACRPDPRQHARAAPERMIETFSSFASDLSPDGDLGDLLRLGFCLR